MDMQEIDKFVQKFKHLWKTGCDAHLDIDTHAGQVWEGIRGPLGCSPGTLHEVHPHKPNHSRKTRDGPSRVH